MGGDSQDGQPVAIAVICEEWRNGTETLENFVQVTTPANALISRITDRMPAILPSETWPTWLGETDASPAEVKALLRTFEDGGNWVMRSRHRKGRRDRPSRRGLIPSRTYSSTRIRTHKTELKLG
jgi:putative SOS response-associated peptidase YedK